MSEEKKTVPAYPFMSSFQRKTYPPASQWPSIFPASPHHDGKLDTGVMVVEYGEVYQSYKKTIQGIHICDEDECVYLDPKQSLSLLAWLRQEEGKLQKLAKDEV